jgi:hypothetical protein
VKYVLGLTLLLILMLIPVQAKEMEWWVIRCGGAIVQFNVKAHPNGIPLTERQICKCQRKRWRGLECDLQYLAKELKRKQLQVNEELIDIVQGKK